MFIEKRDKRHKKRRIEKIEGKKGPFVIGVAGPMGSGKTYFVEMAVLYLQSLGIIVQITSAGDVFRGMLIREGGDPEDRKLLHQKSKGLLKTVEYHKILDWFMENTPNIDWSSGIIIIDGIRHPDSYKRMKCLFGRRCALVYCHCPDEIRFERIVKRGLLTAEIVEQTFSDEIENSNAAYFLDEATQAFFHNDNPIEVIARIVPLLPQENIEA